MITSSRILDGSYEFLAVLGLAFLVACSRGEDQGTSRPLPSVPPAPPRVAPATATRAPVPGVAKGGISFVALPNADIRLFAAGTSQEVPLPGRSTPLYIAVAPGIYRVELTFPGARPATRDVTVEQGRSILVKVVDARLRHRKSRGRLGTRVRDAGRASGWSSLLFPRRLRRLRQDALRSFRAGNETARLFTAYALAGSVLRTAGRRVRTCRVPALSSKACQRLRGRRVRRAFPRGYWRRLPPRRPGPGARGRLLGFSSHRQVIDRDPRRDDAEDGERRSRGSRAGRSRCRGGRARTRGRGAARRG